MRDYANYEDILKLIEEMVDLHSDLDEFGVREFDSGNMNYEELKKLTSNKILQLLLDVNNNKELSETDKFISVASSMTYLAMENFVLHVNMLKV